MVLLSLLLNSYRVKYSSNVQLSLNHLTRIVTTKYQLFLKSSKSRITPRFVSEFYYINLSISPLIEIFAHFWRPDMTIQYFITKFPSFKITGMIE